MLDEELQEKLLKVFDKRFQDYNSKVLWELGQIIAKFKDLTPSQANVLAQQLKFSNSAKEVLAELSKQGAVSVKDLKKILERVAKENSGFAETYYKAREIDMPVYKENKALQNLVSAIYKQSGEEFKNIAKSTGFRLLDVNKKPLLLNIQETYNEVIDRCVIAVMEGKETYQQTMRSTLKQLAESGVRKIEYKSGYSRRIDTSVRMNILDSTRQISNESQKLFGKEFDADGIEISTHLNPSPDHSNVQGHQFSNKEYEKLQSTGVATDYNGEVIDIRIKDNFRPISTMNCFHYIFSIVLGVSKPQYSNEELKKIIDDNEKGAELDGKHYTNYELTQIMRKLETKIREQKDLQIIARASDDKDLILQAQTKITQLTNKYKQVVKISGLPNQLSTRGRVYNYHRVSIKNLKK